MTKEEILNNNTFGLTDYVGYWPEEAVIAAMGEYAKQQIVEFNKWVTIEGYYCGFGNWWYDENKEEIAKTTEELYNQFIESQQTNNQ